MKSVMHRIISPIDLLQNTSLMKMSLDQSTRCIRSYQGFMRVTVLCVYIRIRACACMCVCVSACVYVWCSALGEALLLFTQVSLRALAYSIFLLMMTDVTRTCVHCPKTE